MKIYIENLGVLRQTEFSTGDLTIICGMNNTGKTYVTYALYGFLSFWQDGFFPEINYKDIRRLQSEGFVHIDLEPYIQQAQNIITRSSEEYQSRLKNVFAAQEERFNDTVFRVSIDPKKIKPLKRKYQSRISSASSERFSISKKEGELEIVVSLLTSDEKARIPLEILNQFIGNAIKEIVFSNVLPNPFIASAERTGAAIFRKELNFQRNRLLEEMTQTDKNIDPMELLFKVYQDYPLPVKKSVEFTRELEAIATRTSFLVKEHPSLLKDFAGILGGEYTDRKSVV